VARQKQFCLGLLASKGLDGPFVLAKDAVKTAHSTAALTAAAKTTVLNLGYPCDTLEQAGTDAGLDGGCGTVVCRTGGQTCGANGYAKSAIRPLRQRDPCQRTSCWTSKRSG
jgi:hypothetical protein